mmetsp:Transcript_22163/g.63585  ORF Transcript_22163/g.63585 Transcript_22163/m.63585 type:complete len:230 (-) Transcript_22163:1120-1809(-)
MSPLPLCRWRRRRRHRPPPPSASPSPTAIPAARDPRGTPAPRSPAFPTSWRPRPRPCRAESRTPITGRTIPPCRCSCRPTRARWPRRRCSPPPLRRRVPTTATAGVGGLGYSPSIWMLLESTSVLVQATVLCPCRQGRTPSRRNQLPPAVPRDFEACPSSSSPLGLEATTSCRRPPPRPRPSRPPMPPAGLEAIPSSSIPSASATAASTRPTPSPRSVPGGRRSTRLTS